MANQKLKIVCVSHRQWAFSIFDNLSKNTDHIFIIIKAKSNISIDYIEQFNPDYILFYGWSWLVPDFLISKYKCLMLHPSALPLFRGGSPIQNQIINNVVDSKVTIFVMNNQLDSGDIIASQYLSLRGNLDSIFKDIIDIGTSLTLDIFNNNFSLLEQDHSKATYFKRRKPEESEITIEQLKNSSSEYLYNKIRMLADPYPNAFIRTIDGKKLILKSVEIE